MALDILDEPLRVKKPQRWFVANKGDLFGEGVSNEEIAAVFGVMSAAAHHTFQVLTKRPERMVEWFAWASAEGTPWERVTSHGAKAIGSPVGYGMGHRDWPLSNVWIGVSVEDHAGGAPAPCQARGPRAGTPQGQVEVRDGAAQQRVAQSAADKVNGAGQFACGLPQQGPRAGAKSDVRRRSHG